MPSFLKGCFKLRRSKKKKVKKTEQCILPLSDITTAVHIDEIIKKCEPTSSCSIINDEETMNYSNQHILSNTSINTLNNNSQRSVKENKEVGDSCNDDDLIDSEKSVDDNQEVISAEYDVSHLTEDSHGISEHLQHKLDKNPVSALSMINTQNVNEVQGANCEINHETTVLKVVEFAEFDEILENILIQKTYEIINKVTVCSDVFESMEKLRAIEDSVKKLHQEKVEKQFEENLNIGDVCDAEQEKDDFHKSLKYVSEKSNKNFESAIESPGYCNDTLNVSGQSKDFGEKPLTKNILVGESKESTQSLTKITLIDESGDKLQDFCKSSKFNPSSVFVTYPDEDEEDPNKVLKKGSRELTSETDQNSDFENLDVKRYSKVKSETPLIEEITDEYDVLEMSLKDKINKFSENNGFELEDDKTVTNKPSNIEICQSEEITISNDMMFKHSEEYTSQNPYKSIISQAKTLSVTNIQEGNETCNDFIDTQINFKHTDHQERKESLEVITSDINLILEYKNDSFENLNPSNTIYATEMSASQNVAVSDLTSKSNFLDYETPEFVEEEIIFNDASLIFKDLTKFAHLRKKHDRQNAENDKHTIGHECTHTIIKSESPYNKIPSIHNEDELFIPFLKTVEANHICSKFNNQKCNKDSDTGSSEHSQQQFKENDTQLEETSEDLFHALNEEDISMRRNGSIDSNLKASITSIYHPSEDGDCPKNQLHRQKYALQNLWRCKINNIAEDEIDNVNTAKEEKNHHDVCDPRMTNYSDSRKCSIRCTRSDVSFTSTTDLEQNEDVLFMNRNANLYKQIKNSCIQDNIFGEKQDVMTEIGDLADSNYELCVNENTSPETDSNFSNGTSDIKSENLLCQSTNSAADTNDIEQIKHIPLNEGIHDVKSDSLTSLFKSAEYCQDDNDYREETDENDVGNTSEFQQFQEPISTQLDQESVKCQNKQTSFLCVSDNFQQPSNDECLKINKYKVSKYYPEGHDNCAKKKKGKTSKNMSLKNEKNNSSAYSKALYNSTVPRFSKQKIKKDSQSINTTDNISAEETQNKLSSNKHNAVFVPENTPKAKSVSKYSLSECSNSSESVILPENCDSVKKHLNVTGSDRFIVNVMGYSGDKEGCFDQNRVYRKYTKPLLSSAMMSELHHAFSTRKKTRNGLKYKIRVKKTGSSKIPQNDKINDKIKHESENDATIQMQIGDHIKVSLNENQNLQDSEITRTTTKKRRKPLTKDRTSLKTAVQDEIEMRRLESIKLFEKRKNLILSQMGPNIRIIPIQKVEKFQVMAFKVEKFCSKTDIAFLGRKHRKTKYSPDILTSPIKKNNVTDGIQKSPSIKVTDKEKSNLVQDESLPTEAFDVSSEKMTPIRKQILDSSRSIRSPKYPFPLTNEITDKKETNPVKPAFIKSSKRKVVTHLFDNESNILTLKDKYEKFVLPTKITSVNVEDKARQVVQHTQNYRATSPDDLKSKFDKVFKRYAGKGRSNGDLISYKRSTEWLRDAGVIGKLLTSEDATAAFKAFATGKVAINKGDYREFLKRLTRVKRLNYTEVYEKLTVASSRCME